MDRIKIITDTPSDIPDALVEEYGIHLVHVPIAIDGEGYYERKSFSTQEFYKLLEQSDEIPTTSRVPAEDYLLPYREAYQAGYTHVINVTINAGGSGMYTSAIMARDLFYEETPEARDKMQIHVIDSRTYSMAYGYPVLQAAKMAQGGVSISEILAYLDDFFDRVEVYLGCFTLEYAKKSGRIGAAAAFVGDVLGLRPIIQMIDGQTKVVDKVRGDKNLPGRLVEVASRSCPDKSTPILVGHGTVPEEAQALCKMAGKEWGCEIEPFFLGAAVVINAGPRSIGTISLGAPRGNASHKAHA